MQQPAERHVSPTPGRGKKAIRKTDRKISFLTDSKFVESGCFGARHKNCLRKGV